MNKSKMIIIAIILFVVVLVFGVFYFWRIVLSKEPNPLLTKSQLHVGNAIFTVEMATTTVEQARGLSFRSNLANGTGMLFPFSPGIQNFWMKDMNFSIDIIWISGNKVVGFAQNAAPQPGVPLWGLTIYTSPDGVDNVLEVNAGVVAKDNIAIGDPVVFGQGVAGRQ
jgi:uncharacterized membrane protein (UPF0127 family)